jgi:DnaK suppressor protein
MREARAGGESRRDAPDHEESAEVDIHEEVDFVLMQMQAEALLQVDAALRRVEEGGYGDCCECHGQISEARLTALPFAARCRECEAAREEQVQRAATARRDTWDYV